MASDANGAPGATTTIITYGKITRDIQALPLSSLLALARRGLAHVFGNEAASKVGGEVDKAAGVTDEMDKAAKDAARAAWKTANKAAFDALVESTQAALLAALDAGTLGAASRGPRGTSADTVAREIAEKELVKILNQHGIKRPKKAADAITMPNGEAYTMAQLIERRLSDAPGYGHGARIRKAADAELAKLAKIAAGTGDAGDSLGL